jgi:hypothetical protein
MYKVLPYLTIIYYRRLLADRFRLPFTEMFAVDAGDDVSLGLALVSALALALAFADDEALTLLLTERARCNAASVCCKS